MLSLKLPTMLIGDSGTAKSVIVKNILK